MGVRKMNNLVKHSEALERFVFSNSWVIIDGPNLYYSLYFNSDPKLDQQHGGDYSAFRELVLSFFNNLKKCKITPLVVLDGGSEPGKEDTIKNRMQDKIQKAKTISESKAQSWDNILPPLVKDIFIQILQEEKIEMEQCLGEADQTVVRYANEKKCPVLSNDSDFYIFDVPEGFLLINEFQWRKVEEGGIPAQRYKISAFCERFNVDRNHMAVFAAISGNDYSRLEDKEEFIKRYPEPQQPGTQQPKSQQPVVRQRAILRFLGDLRGKTNEEAVRAALQLVGKTSEEDIRPFLESTLKYNVDQDPPRPDLPAWVITAVQEGSLTSFVTSVVTYRSMTLTPLVEDFSKPSSYAASLRLRQFFYGLLIGKQPCREYDRKWTDMNDQVVTPELPDWTAEDLQKLELAHLNEAPEDLRRRVLYEALRYSTSDTENVPDRLKLPLCVTRFWFQYRQQNHPEALNESCLQALLLGFVYGEDGADPSFKATMDGLLPGNQPGSRLKLGVAHAFSQWQNCMRQSLHLNQLLRFPLPEPPCYRLYCGPLLHQLQKVLEGNTNMFSELRNLLDEKHSALLETSLRITGSQLAGAGPPGRAKEWQTEEKEKEAKSP
ncbi:protein asteroid homolog 1-like [Fundulus heteroclitus]|uniref:protein asteroid homolog 1-like n=1 Tax=Fundulus heteroclitus TaxID=8078 RepID=UPI00165A540D|nr:protein asteroid homolog 1-like [Fundulus heteroclitus]